MKKLHNVLRPTSLLAIAVVGAGCAGNNGVTLNPNIAAVTSGAGDAAALAATVDTFRTQLGGPLNTTPGAMGGRREINWDAVPALQTNTDTFPGDFFDSSNGGDPAGRKRGATFATVGGTGFRVSDDDFNSLNGTYGVQFNAFSPAKTFSPIGSNKMDVTFHVPGTTTPAKVSGFGAVFADVDKPNITSIEPFSGNTSLGRFFVPVSSTGAGAFSFLGITTHTPMITRVRIVLGDASITVGQKDLSDGSASDVVVLDDFLYGEPVAQ